MDAPRVHPTCVAMRIRIEETPTCSCHAALCSPSTAGLAGLGSVGSPVGPAALRRRPFQPTAGDTRRAYEPFFTHLAAAVGRPLQLTVTTDWAGIAVAVANGQVDCAWMGPWGFVLAKDRARAEALAVVHYQGRPTYQAIILARPELAIARFPEDARGMSISFADAGSTSGWLIPHFWFRGQGIDPRTYFATATAPRIRRTSWRWPTAMWISHRFRPQLRRHAGRGRVQESQARIVWRSEPLPNDAWPCAVTSILPKAALRRGGPPGWMPRRHSA
jgi:phosphonate transport system substrate-binding protein